MLVIHTPCDSHFHHEETLKHWETCSKMFIALFFIKVHNEKQSKCPSTVEQKYYSIYKYNTTQVGIKIAGKNINNLRYADDTTLMEDSKEELKSFLMKVKKESEKVSLKLNIQKTKIMAFSPITSWQIHGETIETVTDFIFLDSKITADGDCSHEIKKCLLLGRKAVTNLDSILKSRDTTLPTKVRLVKAMVFPVVIYGCESWTIGKLSTEELMLFELWC